MLDEERREYIRATRDSVGAIAPPGGTLDRVRAQRFTQPGFEPNVWEQMGEMGWIGLRLPEDQGGVGKGVRESVALQEELGRGLVPEPLIAGSLAATMLAHTTETRLLEQVLQGRRIVALAWQANANGLEPAHDLARPRLFVPFAGMASPRRH